MILLGNSFPLSLIRRPVTIGPAALEDLQRRVAESGFLSYWGHDNTRAAAAALLGFDPAPFRLRPALSLDAELLPVLDGHSFASVWILSPDYIAGFRPQVGVEVDSDAILGWQVLHIRFSVTSKS